VNQWLPNASTATTTPVGGTCAEPGHVPIDPGLLRSKLDVPFQGHRVTRRSLPQLGSAGTTVSGLAVPEMGPERVRWFTLLSGCGLSGTSPEADSPAPGLPAHMDAITPAPLAPRPSSSPAQGAHSTLSLSRSGDAVPSPRADGVPRGRPRGPASRHVPSRLGKGQRVELPHAGPGARVRGQIHPRDAELWQRGSHNNGLSRALHLPLLLHRGERAAGTP